MKSCIFVAMKKNCVMLCSFGKFSANMVFVCSFSPQAQTLDHCVFAQWCLSGFFIQVSLSDSTHQALNNSPQSSSSTPLPCQNQLL